MRKKITLKYWDNGLAESRRQTAQQQQPAFWPPFGGRAIGSLCWYSQRCSFVLLTICRLPNSCRPAATTTADACTEHKCHRIGVQWKRGHAKSKWTRLDFPLGPISLLLVCLHSEHTWIGCNFGNTTQKSGCKIVCFDLFAHWFFDCLSFSFAGRWQPSIQGALSQYVCSKRRLRRHPSPSGDAEKAEYVIIKWNEMTHHRHNGTAQQASAEHWPWFDSTLRRFCQHIHPDYHSQLFFSSIRSSAAESICRRSFQLISNGFTYGASDDFDCRTPCGRVSCPISIKRRWF